MDRPDVFSHIDFRAWLSAWFEWKKVANPRFSHRGVARAVGESSPGFLGDVIKGRRNLTSVRLDALAALIGLDEEERGFFRLLVALDQAGDLDERRRVWEKVAGTHRFRSARRIEGDSYAYLSHWYYPAIRELACREDFCEDPDWVASMLVPAITAYQAREALNALFSLGMLVREAGGGISQSEGSLVTPRQVAGLAAHAYHRGMLERAREGIALFRPEERHHVGATVCVPESLIPRLKEELDHIAARLFDLCEGAEGAERVVQLEVALVPLSRSTR